MQAIIPLITACGISPLEKKVRVARKKAKVKIKHMVNP